MRDGAASSVLLDKFLRQKRGQGKGDVMSFDDQKQKGRKSYAVVLQFAECGDPPQIFLQHSP